ncbi:MAG: sigma-70 family RNA polymerase sigma factor [Deltaproteobacteria bacterium]|nr:sigma-70 family RNA polymerase sigma factor [Deltaproteobacteria bacterium]
MAERDDELLEKARHGDGAALDALLARHERQIFRFGLRMCGSEEDAREVLQETLMAAFKNLPGFRGEADLSTWLYQLARSFCIKSRRKRVGEPATHEALEGDAMSALASEAPSPDAQAHARELGDVLQAAIRALPDDYREIVILKDVEGLSADEAAKVLDEDVAAVKSRLHRARMQLRHNLATLLGSAEAAGVEPCPELAEQLSRYVAHEIDQAACVALEKHLATCDRCAGACESLQRTVSLCRQIPGDAVPAPVRSAVRQALVSMMGQAGA